ncbi:MAG: rRNA maturation RNase YbeY [Verrucomicrobiia bacterium]|jgi:probable rRNA maturation factor
MTPDGMRERVTVSNRQRRLKINARRLAEVAEHALELVGDKQFHLGIVLVNDGAIARLNAQYHHTQGPTDVLSFDYGEGQRELIISVERAVIQARRYRTTPGRELVLYVVHGILHLHGYNDLTALQRRRMRVAERRLMSHLRNHFDLNRLA